MRDRRGQAVTRTEDAEPFNNDDLIDLASRGRCMLTGLLSRETPWAAAKRYRGALGKSE